MKHSLAVGQLALPVDGDDTHGSALVKEVGARDESLGNDYASRTPWDALVELGNGEWYRTKVWWTGRRWAYSVAGPFVSRVRRGITLTELDS